MVCRPRSEAVGLVDAKVVAQRASGSENAIVIVQIPSMNTQHHSENVIWICVDELRFCSGVIMVQCSAYLPGDRH